MAISSINATCSASGSCAICQSFFSSCTTRIIELGGEYYRLMPEGTLTHWDGLTVTVNRDLEGLDLNRNFPTNWSAEWDRDGCWDYGPTTGGTGPGSEPETRALMGFLQTHRVEALISYHSAALGVFPGGEPWEKNSIAFAKALAKSTKYPFPPIDTGCIFTGTLADYAVEFGAVSVDMELSTHKHTDFKQNVKALEVLLHWEY